MAFITLYGIVCSMHLAIRVWGIVYLSRVYQSLQQINELLHTFFYCYRFPGARAAKTHMMVS